MGSKSWSTQPAAAGDPGLLVTICISPAQPQYTAKYIYSEPILLGCTITIVCNSLFLPMGLFPFISFISVLFPQVQRTREGYKDDIMPMSLGSLQMEFLHHQIISASPSASLTTGEDLHQLKSSYTHTHTFPVCLWTASLIGSFSPTNVYDCKKLSLDRTRCFLHFHVMTANRDVVKVTTYPGCLDLQFVAARHFKGFS